MSNKSRQISGGLVIIFEGLDGVGKTTQLGLAAEALRIAGWAVHTTRNLGGTPIGEALREVALSPLDRSPATDLYISAAVQSALAEALEMERQSGKIILVDRGPLSMVAYQVYGRGAEHKRGWQYVGESMKAYHPEAVLFYQTDVATAIARNQKTSKKDYYEVKPTDFFERVSHGFQLAIKRYPVIEIDASQSIEAVHQATMAIIQKLLAKST